MSYAIGDPTIERRYRVDDHGSQFIITIPRKWNWGIFAIEPAIGAVLIYLFPSWKQELAKSKVAFVIGVIVGLAFLREWLWNLGGQEVVVIGNDEMALRRELFGFSWSAKFDLNAISDLRYVEAKGDGEGKGTPPGIGFEYRGRQKRFGDDLSEPEANQLLDIIENRFPELRRSAPEHKHFITLDI